MAERTLAGTRRPRRTLPPLARSRRLGRQGRQSRPKPPPKPDDGRMTLVEHLRELRSRLVKSLIAMIPGSVLGWIYYERIIHFLLKPGCDAHVVGLGGPPGVVTGKSCTLFALNGLTAGINLNVTVAIATGLTLAAPVWLYQLWAFVTPGLHRHERRWSLAFVLSAVPLFFAGASLCYFLLPTVVKVLLGFTPEDTTPVIYVADYLNLIGHLMLAFGLAFELPVFVILLNAVGALPARRILQHWRGIVFGIFVFAAVATPTGDPYTMLALATPMVVLLAVAYVFCLWNDRRRRRSGEEPDYRALDDDELSPL